MIVSTALVDYQWWFSQADGTPWVGARLKLRDPGKVSRGLVDEDFPNGDDMRTWHKILYWEHYLRIPVEIRAQFTDAVRTGRPGWRSKSSGSGSRHRDS